VKNKRLLIIFGIFVVIVLAAVIGSAVFSVQNIEFVFKNEFNEIVPEDNDLWEFGHYRDAVAKEFKGKSILVLNRKKLVEVFENSNPWVGTEVSLIETVFPNTLRITAYARVPVFHFQNKDGFFSCDHEGFVIANDKLTKTVEVISAALFSADIKVGTYLSFGHIEIVKDVIDALWIIKDEPTERRTYSKIADRIQSLVFSGDEPLLIKMAHGAQVLMVDPSVQTAGKFTAVYGAFLSDAIPVNSGTYKVGQYQYPDGTWQILPQ